MKKILQNLIIIGCLFAFCFFAYKIYNYYKEEDKQKNLNDNLIEVAVKETEQEDSENEDDDKIKLPINVDFKVLKNQNQDIIAWLYSQDTPINYPIVQANDNDYYLRRLIDGTYNQAGTLFIDYRNNSDFNDYKTIVYGHNMKNETMFGTLINYTNQEYYDEHKEMYLLTENKNFKIELIAGYTTSNESNIYTLPTTININEELLQTAIRNSTFKSEVKVTTQDKIIVMSTCSYDYENARYVLLGVLREIK